MKSSTALLLALPALAWASPNNPTHCAADNCARAVTGTAKGTAHVATARADCSNFMAQTVIGAASTVTITDFVTVTAAPGAAKEKRDSQTIKVVPTYASACSGISRYSSACSCWGITATTTTVFNGVSTVTVSSTITTSGTATTSGTPTSPVNPTGPTFDPAVPTSYAGCILDPNTSATFQLLDADSGLPIIDNGGIASLGNSLTSDPFHFSKPANAPPGIFDMVIETGGSSFYYAIFESGKIGFVTTSSNGQTFVGTGDKYVTSVFAIGCDGSVTAGIVGGAAFIFSVVNNNAVVTDLGSGSGSNKAKRDIPVPPGYYVLPTTPPPSSKGTRCPSADQTAVSKNPSPPQTSNGCGSDTFPSKYAPNLWFKPCCDQHDICFNQCSSTFDDCNSAFLTCNLAQCDAIPFVFDPESGGDIQPGYIPCVLAAHLYGYAVTTSGGDDAIKAATAEYCDCKCTDTTKTACGANCVDLLTDPNNCGSCNFFCPSGGCTNGACSFNSCGGETCETFGPCGPGGSCVCASITDNTGFCVDGNTPCAGLADCSDSADCALGSVCAVATCCQRNVCIATDFCGGFGTGSKMLTRGFRGEGVWERGYVNGTISSKGTWVPKL